MGDLTILVVDDDGDCRDLYAIWLDDEHTLRFAADGSEGLDRLDETVDVVMSGLEVAHRIADGPFDPHVVMVSSMAADFDLHDVPIDDYARKPVDEGTVQSVLGQFRTQHAYHAALDDFFSLTARLGALEAEKTERELADSEEYQHLQRRVAEKRAEVNEAIATAETDWSVVFKNCASVDGANANSQNV
jgi:CheY-like chemotaxis protein